MEDRLGQNDGLVPRICGLVEGACNRMREFLERFLGVDEEVNISGNLQLRFLEIVSDDKEAKPVVQEFLGAIPGLRYADGGAFRECPESLSPSRRF